MNTEAVTDQAWGWAHDKACAPDQHDPLCAAVPNELREAALAHVIEWYGGPDDDTLPVLRDWLRDIERYRDEWRA